MRLRILTGVVCIITLFGFSQTTIYSEDFTGQLNKGAIGPGGSNPIIDLDGVNWTIDVSDNNLANTNDYFIVRNVSGNEIFEGRDLDGNAIWFSPLINIDGFTDVSFTLEASESNGTSGNNIETTDIMTTEYRIDGGNWQVAESNGTISDDYDLTIVSQTGLTGSSLELRITIINNGGGERMRFDNIEVSGLSCSAEPIPFTENFDSSASFPQCWTTFRGDNGLGTGFDWEVVSTASNSPSNSAFVRYEDVSEGSVAEDWLVTPAIDLGTNPTQLSFFGRQQFTNEWNTDYTVRISTTSPTDINSFTTLVTYGESDFGFVFEEKIIDLSAYTGVVYIAFVMEQDDGDNWYIDDVSIDELPPCTVPDNISGLTSNYVNGSVELTWSLGACYDELLIVGKEGSVVTAVPTGDGSLYTGNTSFGDGTEIATNEFVVYKGGGNGTTINNVNFGSTYFFEVFTRKGSAWSSGVTTSVVLDCNVDGDTSAGRYITSVEFSTLNNNTNGDSNLGYIDYTSLVSAPDVRQGTIETLSTSVATNGTSFFGVHVIAWIDWNQDGIFDINTEQYDLGDASNDGPTNLSPGILVPVDAALGITTMRIVCRDRLNPDGPCEDVSDGQIQDYAINILEAIDYTYDNGWSPEDPNGIATLGSDITISSGDAVIDTNTECNSFTVNPGATLTIDSGVNLTANDATRGLTLESNSSQYASLIIDGTVTGTVNYERYVNVVGSGSSGGNDLISMPLIPSAGQSFDEFILLGSPNNASKLATNGVFYAFAPFNNVTGAYENYTVNGTDNLDRGVGYRIATTTGETLSFVGDPLSSDLLNIPVTKPVGGSQWNLVGNPYCSYLNSVGFLSANSEVLDPAAVAIYGYNSGTDAGAGTTGNFTIVNFVTNNSINIAPGQGFLIAVNNTEGYSGVINFSTSMRTLVGSDDFIQGRTTENLNLRLKLKANSKESTTDIYLHDNASIALDPGYDAILFDDFRQDIYTYLPNSNSKRLAIQTINPLDMEEVRIPLGVDLTTGTENIIEVDYSNLPADINVYLEDTETNNVILLNSESYQFNSISNSTSFGRFYLRFNNNILSTSDNEINNLVIYQNKLDNLVIEGQIHDGTTISLFDIQGRQIYLNSITAPVSTYSIETKYYSKGVYIVKINSENGEITKKIILK